MSRRDIDGMDADDLGESEPHDPNDRAPNGQWACRACHAMNSEIDGECQFCECGGLTCERDSCSDPTHFHAEHVGAEGRNVGCALCADGVPPGPAQKCSACSDTYYGAPKGGCPRCVALIGRSAVRS